jgi:hypothetical protein
MNIYKLLTAFAIVMLSFVSSNAQSSKSNKKEQKKAEIANIINTKSYVFEARTALPVNGRQINLTSVMSG